jgi:hypothetical protein
VVTFVVLFQLLPCSPLSESGGGVVGSEVIDCGVQSRVPSKHKTTDMLCFQVNLCISTCCDGKKKAIKKKEEEEGKKNVNPLRRGVTGS